MRGMDINKMERGKRNEYSHNWILDGLVSASKTQDDSTVTWLYRGGFPLGFVSNDNKVAYMTTMLTLKSNTIGSRTKTSIRSFA
jgi:hypothetical protein